MQDQPSLHGSAFGGLTIMSPAMCKFYPVELKGRPSAEIQPRGAPEQAKKNEMRK